MKLNNMEICRLSSFYDLAKNVLMMSFLIIGAINSNNPIHIVSCYIGVICIVTYLMNAADFLYGSLLPVEKRGRFHKYRRILGGTLNLISYFSFVSSAVLYLLILFR